MQISLTEIKMHFKLHRQIQANITCCKVASNYKLYVVQTAFAPQFEGRTLFWSTSHQKIKQITRTHTHIHPTEKLFFRTHHNSPSYPKTTVISDHMVHTLIVYNHGKHKQYHKAYVNIDIYHINQKNKTALYVYKYLKIYVYYII